MEFGFCAKPTLPTPPAAAVSYNPSPDYFIGPLDSLSIFVWRNPELSQTVPVRPDGRISIPLVEDLAAAGKTPAQSTLAEMDELWNEAKQQE